MRFEPENSWHIDCKISGEVMAEMIKNIKNTLKTTGLALTLGLGFIALSGTTAKAQDRDNDDYNQNQRAERREDRQEARRREQRADNRDRREDRRDDREDRREDRREDNGNYNNNGYYGNNGGYYGGNNGYYGGNNGYYGGGGYNSLAREAQQNGYRDGYNKGIEDAREGHNNPQGTSLYRNATNGYDRAYGNRNAYQQAYRQAFLQGFQNAQNRSRGGYGSYNRNRRGY